MNADYIIVYPGGETPASVSESFLDQGKSLILVSPDPKKENKKKKADKKEHRDKCTHIRWNYASPVSAKNTVLSLVNSLEALPDVLVFFPDIPLTSGHTHQISSVEIESIIDMTITGIFFIIKELTAAARKNLPQNIILCLPERPETDNAVINTCYDTAASFGENLFSEYKDTGCRFFGFRNAYSDINRFSDYLLHQLPLLTKKAEGKWNIAGEKSSFFSNRKK